MGCTGCRFYILDFRFGGWVARAPGLMRCQWPATLMASRFCQAVRGLIIKVIVIKIVILPGCGRWHHHCQSQPCHRHWQCWRWGNIFTFTFFNQVLSDTWERCRKLFISFTLSSFSPQQSCLRYMMKELTVLKLREKFFSFSGDDCTIKDMEGRDWFK